MFEQNLIAGPVAGYKMVNEDMTCRGFEFEVGKRHVLGNNEPIELCKNGFHFCQHPSGVWNYYSSGRLFKVLAYDVLDAPVEPGADYKLVCREIELVEEVLIGGEENTGNGNTGYGNTGDYNTGDYNTGNYNTGNGNTGNGNTGDYNTGYGNTGDHHAGSLNIKEEPLILFDKECAVPREDVPWYLVKELADLLMSDKEIDPERYLAIPNATELKIKKLHESHIAKRKEMKS